MDSDEDEGATFNHPLSNDTSDPYPDSPTVSHKDTRSTASARGASNVHADPTAAPPASSAAAPQPGITPQQNIQMEFNDEYVGEAAMHPATKQIVPHGKGALQSFSGKHCYVGDFAMRVRCGNGKIATEKYVLWCRWKDNRPDFVVSARIDYTNGDKYCGYLQAVTENALVSLLRSNGLINTMSKFSVWVNTTVMKKDRWGELVYSNGSRYYGQWDADEQSGFGCFVHTNGDRYIGMWDHGKYDGRGVLFVSKGAPWVYDGFWRAGTFCPINQTTVPCTTLIPDDVDGKLVLPCRTVICRVLGIQHDGARRSSNPLRAAVRVQELAAGVAVGCTALRLQRVRQEAQCCDGCDVPHTVSTGQDT